MVSGAQRLGPGIPLPAPGQPLPPPGLDHIPAAPLATVGVAPERPDLRAYPGLEPDVAAQPWYERANAFRNMDYKWDR